MVVVFDSSTLILLAKITLLRDVTQRLTCLIPEEVEHECTRKPDLMDAQLIRALIDEGDLSVQAVDTPKRLEEQFGLDRGEAAALALAKDQEGTVGVDDKPAIRACKVFGLSFVTAISFVTKAQEEGILTPKQAREKIHRLDEHGRYHPRIIEDALNKVGEAL